MVLNEGFKMRYKVVMSNLFSVVGYPVEPNSKAIVEAKGSIEKSLSIR